MAFSIGSLRSLPLHFGSSANKNTLIPEFKDLGLDRAVYTNLILQCPKITTQDLVKLSPSNLEKFKGIGENRIKHIQRTLERHGLSLSASPPQQPVLITREQIQGTTSIKELGLPDNLRNALSRQGILNVDDLKNTDWLKILAKRSGIGPAILEKIIKATEPLGITLSHLPERFQENASKGYRVYTGAELMTHAPKAPEPKPYEGSEPLVNIWRQRLLPQTSIVATKKTD